MTSALATIDAAEYRGFAARAWHATGIAALAEGSYLTSYAQLSQLFGADGASLHHHVSYLGIADLAAAAVRAERHLEARRVVERALARVDSAPGPRLDQLAARAPRSARRARGRRVSRRQGPVRPGWRRLAV